MFHKQVGSIREAKRAGSIHFLTREIGIETLRDLYTES